MRVLGVGLYLAADVLDVYVSGTGLTVEVAEPEVRHGLRMERRVDLEPSPERLWPCESFDAS
jgi:hypothetical protein